MQREIQSNIGEVSFLDWNYHSSYQDHSFTLWTHAPKETRPKEEEKYGRCPMTRIHLNGGRLTGFRQSLSSAGRGNS